MRLGFVLVFLDNYKKFFFNLKFMKNWVCFKIITTDINFHVKYSLLMKVVVSSFEYL